MRLERKDRMGAFGRLGRPGRPGRPGRWVSIIPYGMVCMACSRVSLNTNLDESTWVALTPI